ncbi:MAG: hypothetical protein SFY56_00940 [Bacteroidota bacterium]|nr:hypothetical protein [Bacteroidota bacterium]
MKIFKTLSLSILLAATTVSSVAKATNSYKVTLVDIPAKTVCMKHPEAADATKYFASATVINFEIYKVGSTADMEKIIKSLSSDANVESCEAGKITGDFSAVTLSLKSAKGKAWFAAFVKKAGLTHIKINNNAPVEADKL